jgi:hypothetical protein
MDAPCSSGGRSLCAVLQGASACDGACLQLFGGRACYACHQAALGPLQAHGEAALRCTYALDLSNAQCAGNSPLLGFRKILKIFLYRIVALSFFFWV